MNYTMQTKSDIKVRVGDAIEVLEAYYFKYANEVIVRKLRHKSHVYILTLPLQSNFDLVKLKAHEGFVEGIKRTPKTLVLHVSLLAGADEYSGNVTDSFRIRH